MLIIKQIEQLGSVQACPVLLDETLAAQEHWQSNEQGVVILDSGILLASPAAWAQQLQSICNLHVLVAERYPSVEWGSAEIAIVRKFLADADAVRRDRIAQAQSTGDTQTMARQALLDIVVDAHRMRATDIHLRMTGSEARISYRIDGLLYHQASRSRTSVTEAVAAALNTQSDDFREVFDERHMSGASISLTLPDSGENIRIRTQKSPCRDGFSVTMRLQASEQQRVPDLYSLGFAPSRVLQLRHVMSQATGLLLISGPTGHGKTTTLAALNRLVPKSRKIISLEDPIEIIQPNIEQKFVPTDQDPYAFAHMIRSVLREDPDLVEVSEIRDMHTANAGISAALTGHLVVSTIHANDAIGIISRLLDLGLTATQLSQPGLFAGLLAQRLLPKLCVNCSKPVNHPQWGAVKEQSSSGCATCQLTGLQGRVAISELIVPNSHASKWIQDLNIVHWQESLRRNGWDSMAFNASELICQGVVDPRHAEELVPGMNELGLQQRQQKKVNYAAQLESV
ncbi:GspE/PulE family protein [Aliidiomarina quisquiliarum]|uniref:GspE/PulE family protein n=1 Tax=Aliidiomarina quisquiliarum TaxID=2938947 RepID=UPI00208E1D64|nr:ATPase, T2SS/T4P/T4SS family [Aliidiomarina quisquiliarum]MCO4322023.1 Flp pilus assembly complex ATPase component TadA [Aliidiomarina quisquiliarum]